jgi:hypothetical protein
MRFVQVLSVLIGFNMLLVSGCGSGGSDTNASPAITASVSTTVSGGQAVCKLSVSGVSSLLCGFEVNLVYPAGATYVEDSAIPSGVASNCLLAANPEGVALKMALISGSGFSSGKWQP